MKSYFVFQRSEFRVLGMLLAMSIVQSGFGLPVLHPAMYQYMMGTAYQEIQLSDDDVRVCCTATNSTGKKIFKGT